MTPTVEIPADLVIQRNRVEGTVYIYILRILVLSSTNLLHCVQRY